MTFYEEKGDKLVKIEVDEQTEKAILEEMEEYRVVRERTIRWEKLDECREGEDTYFDYYKLTEDNYSLTFFIIIKDNHFHGVQLFHYSTTKWDAGLNEERSLCGGVLFVDGTRLGDVSSTSSYDSPNNHDDVEIEYRLEKIAK